MGTSIKISRGIYPHSSICCTLSMKRVLCPERRSSEIQLSASRVFIAERTVPKDSPVSLDIVAMLGQQTPALFAL